MGGLFSKPKMPAVPEPKPIDDGKAEEARRQELIAQRKQKGRAATLLTGPDGDTSEAPAARKTLLGQ